MVEKTRRDTKTWKRKKKKHKVHRAEITGRSFNHFEWCWFKHQWTNKNNGVWVLKILLRDLDAHFPLEHLNPWGGIENLSLKGWLLYEDLTHILLLSEPHIGIRWNDGVDCGSTYSIQTGDKWCLALSREGDAWLFKYLCSVYSPLPPFPWGSYCQHLPDPNNVW